MEKTIEEIKKEAMDNVTAIAKEQAEKAVEGVSKAIEGVAKAEEVNTIKTDLEKQIAELSSTVKKQSQMKHETEKAVSIADAISGALADNAETLKSFKGSQGLAMKAVTAASFASTSLANQTTNVRRDLYSSPYSPMYLRNIFPNISTDAGSVVIPQLQEVTGTADLWARGTGSQGADVEKPEVSPLYKDVTVNMSWLAGITHVNRELLLNVNYLQGSITNTLLYGAAGLYARENKLITDYLAAGGNAAAYSGAKTIAMEKIIDAAFGQMLSTYINPTHVLMNNADYLTYIKLNKAVGSGEYDMPNDILRGFTGTGLETAVQIIPVPTLAAGTAYVISAPEFEFINRLSPELRVSEEHGTNFTYNKVTFRVEEMVGFISKNVNAAVKITL